MTVRKLSSTGDFTFGGGSANFYSNVPAAVGQVVGTSLLLFLGEWFLDQTIGMPWLEGVLGKHNQATADVTVQDYILGVQGVTDISSYGSIDNQDNRKYTASATIDTIYGPTPVQISNYPLF